MALFSIDRSHGEFDIELLEGVNPDETEDFDTWTINGYWCRVWLVEEGYTIELPDEYTVDMVYDIQDELDEQDKQALMRSLF